MRHSRSTRRRRLAALAAAGLATGVAAAASAASDPCRDWEDEHTDYKARVVHGYLTSAPQGQLDADVFELIQREAYLTSCPDSVAAERSHRVGWRLVGLGTDGYAGAVVDSVLEQGGFALDLRPLFGEPPREPRRAGR